MGTAITIGNFDGVHMGHRALVAAAREGLAQREGTVEGHRVVAVVFDPHPMSLLRPDGAPARLSTMKQREGWLRQVGCTDVVVLSTTADLLATEADVFILELMDRVKALTGGFDLVVEGDDFRFGKSRAGDIGLLRAMGDALSFGVQTVHGVDVALSDHSLVRASSSISRWLLSHGRVDDARRVLGRDYEVTGTVQRGDQKGRTIGVPTANVMTDQLFPSDGVYAAMARLPDGSSIAAAVNVGSRPTVEGIERRIEAHLLNAQSMDGRVLSGGMPLEEYGWPLTIGFRAFVRDQVRFPSFDALRQQISRDLVRVEQLLAVPR
jgi:riboflavin kinase/FMN adenylyltransferase